MMLQTRCIVEEMGMRVRVDVMRARGALSALVALALTGCSFLDVRATPRPDPFTSRPSCASRAIPVIDLVQAPVWFGLAAASFLSIGSQSNPDAHGRSEAQVAAAGVMVGVSITALASSIYGFVNIGKCRRALGPQ
jgi:hypothetical protein